MLDIVKLWFAHSAIPLKAEHHSVRRQKLFAFPRNPCSPSDRNPLRRRPDSPIRPSRRSNAWHQLSNSLIIHLILLDLPSRRRTIAHRIAGPPAGGPPYLIIKKSLAHREGLNSCS